MSYRIGRGPQSRHAVARREKVAQRLRLEDVRYPGAEAQIGVGFIPITAAGASVVLNAGNLISSIFGGGGSKRADKLKKDAAEAAAAGGSANQDYLLYRQNRGGNVTRYEYDNLRRPLESQSREAQIASGLFPFSLGTGSLTASQADAVLRDVTANMMPRSSSGAPLYSAQQIAAGQYAYAPQGAAGPSNQAPQWIPIAVAGAGALALAALLRK